MPDQGNIFLKGSFQIQITDPALSATLVFEPDSAGEEWNSIKLYRLLQEKRLNSYASTAKLDEFLYQWMNATKQQQAVIARGKEPELTINDEIRWEVKEIPDDLVKTAQQILEKAPPPKIFTRIVKKVKVEKVIKKASLFGKAETVDAWEDKKTEVEVLINEEIRATWYIEEGDIAGEIIRGRPGKPGRDIFGIPVRAEPVEKLTVYPGNGIKFAKDKYIADISGFIRQGDNWIDIVPYSTVSFKVFMSDEDGSCLLSLIPTGERPDEDEIYRKAVELGFREAELIEKTQLKAMIDDAVSKNKLVKGVRICKSKDGEVRIDISPDKCKAFLNIRKGCGNGRLISLKDVGNAIKKSKIIPHDKEKLKKDIIDFFKSSHRLLKEYVLKSGKTAERGKDGSLHFFCSFLNEEKRDTILKNLKLLNAGQKELPSLNIFPLYNVNELALVKKDQNIAQIIAPEKGRGGLDVFNNPVQPVRGNDPDLKLYENLKINRNIVYAQADGLLEKGKSGKTTQLRVRKYRDAQVIIKIANDSMEAYLSLVPPIGGGKPVTRDMIEVELSRLQVNRGVDKKTIHENLKKALKNEEIKDVLIASGRPPVHNTGKRLMFKVMSGTNKEETKTDLEIRNQVIQVKKGNVIAELVIPKTEPADGWDIKGNVIKYKEVAPLNITYGRHIIQKEQDNGNLLLLAEESGELFYDGNLLDIKDSRRIDGNVQPEDCPLATPGTLRISGNVLPGCRIKAGGNIYVEGDIHDSVLSAEGSIFVTRMCLGKGKAYLRSKKDISVDYANKATLLAVGDILLNSGGRDSVLKSNGRIYVFKGDISSGSIRARKGLEVVNLGSPLKEKLTISFGQDYLINDQIELEEREIEKLKKQISIIDRQIKGAGSQLQALSQAKFRALKIVEKRISRLFTLREKFEEHIPSEIAVLGTAYPGIVLESHGRYLEITEELKKIKFLFDTTHGKIVQTNL
ncbi:MAG: DUF342 domain-containing protein [Spirochaetales bacterium]|nr:DUF342 domain-containing protein [Spirochaetales bacterium]